MKVGDLTLGLLVDSPDFKSQITKAATEAGDAGAKTLSGRFKAGLSGLGQSVKAGFGIGAGISAFGVVEDAIRGTINAMSDMAQAARDDEANVAKLTTALKNNVPGWDGNTAAIDERIKAGEKLAFTDDQIRDSMASLVTRTHDVGEALDLQSIAMDLARAKGIDLTTAAEIVGKVHGGNIGILARYGIAVTKGATATEALAQIQKATAGQAQAYGESSAGAAESVQIAFSEIGESIGTLALPLLKAFSEVMRDVVVPGIRALIDIIGDVLDGIGEFVKANQGLFDTLSNLAHIAGDVLFAAIGAVIGVVGELGYRLGGLIGVITDVLGAIIDFGDAIIRVLNGDFEGAAEAAERGLARVGSAGENILRVLGDAGQRTRDELARAGTEGGEQLATNVQRSLPELVAIFPELGRTINAGLAAGLSRDREIRDAIVNAWGKTMERQLDENQAMAAAGGRKSAIAYLTGVLKERSTNDSAWEEFLNMMKKPMTVAQEMAAIRGRLTSKAYVEGINSGDPLIRAAALEQQQIQTSRWIELYRLAWNAGQRVGVLFGQGLNSPGSLNAIRGAARNAAREAAGALYQESPADYGPLSEGGGSFGWGVIFGELFAKGIRRTLGDVRGAAGMLAGATGMALPNFAGALAGASLTQTVRHEGTVHVAFDGQNLPAGVDNDGIGRAFYELIAREGSGAGLRWSPG